MAFLFALKRSIILPQEDGSYLVYPKSTFSFAYSVVPNPKARSLRISLLLANSTTEEIKRTIAEFEVTDAGFPTDVIVNQTEIDTWQESFDAQSETYSTAAQAYALKKQNELALLAELPTNPNVQQDLDLIVAELVILFENMENEKKSLDDIRVARPVAQLLFINKYDDLIGYFNNDGSITDAGIVWARTVPFFGATIGDFLE
jgi:hypothetical protein